MSDDAALNGASPAPDGDVPMEEAGQSPVANGEHSPKKDVKLDELFADVDSDDEFPSSRPQDEPSSSSPSAPSSPGYGARDGESRGRR